MLCENSIELRIVLTFLTWLLDDYVFEKLNIFGIIIACYAMRKNSSENNFRHYCLKSRSSQVKFHRFV